MKNPKKAQAMPEEITQTPNSTQMQITTEVQQVASDYAASFTDEELLQISGSGPSGIKNFIELLAAELLGFSTSILPGRPDRPKKPTF